MASMALGNSTSSTISSGNKTATARCTLFAGPTPTARIGSAMLLSFQPAAVRRHQVISVWRIALLSPDPANWAEAGPATKSLGEKPGTTQTSLSASFRVGDRSPNRLRLCIAALLLQPSLQVIPDIHAFHRRRSTTTVDNLNDALMIPDTTSLHFEGRGGETGERGHSKDY